MEIVEPGRRRRLLGVAQGHELAEGLGALERLGGVGLGEQLLPGGGRGRRDVGKELEERLDARVDPTVGGDVVGHGGLLSFGGRRGRPAQAARDLTTIGGAGPWRCG